MDGDGWRDGMSLDVAVGDQFICSTAGIVGRIRLWRDDLQLKIRVNQRSAAVLEEKTLQLETHSLQLA